MTKIVLASANPGKVKEFNLLFAEQGIEVVAQTALNVASVEETGLSFVENAILKARHAAAETGLAAIADDSGIEVDALNGAPGIYSARYAGVDASDADNNQKLLDALSQTPAPLRAARYQCLLVYMRHAKDPTPVICQGTWEGRIQLAATGTGGFGYDPLFYLDEYQCSAAELEPAIKNRVSHRAQALQAFIKALGLQNKPIIT